MKVLLQLLLGTGFHHILQQGDAAGRRWWAVSKSAGSQSHDTWRSSSPLTCKNMENPSALEASYLRLGISSSHLSEGLPSLSSVFTMISWFPAFALLEGWSPEGWTSASWFSCNSSIRLLTSAVTSQGLQRDHSLGRVFLQCSYITWAARVGRTNVSSEVKTEDMFSSFHVHLICRCTTLSHEGQQETFR